VSVETFANVSLLELLSLSYSNLRTVDINILRALPNISAMLLYYNPLQCDCHLQEVWRWCKDRNIETGYGGREPECDTPSEVKGMWWGVLKKEECLRGNIHYKNTNYIYTDIDNTFAYKQTDMQTDTDKDMDTETNRTRKHRQTWTLKWRRTETQTNTQRRREAKVGNRAKVTGNPSRKFNNISKSPIMITNITEKIEFLKIIFIFLSYILAIYFIQIFDL